MSEKEPQGPPAFKTTPACVAAPPFPDRPDLYDEVQWGPFPSQEDTDKAYLLWFIQDHTLLTTSDWHHRKNPPREDAVWVKDNAAYCLVNTVYDHILEKCHEPLTENKWDAEAQYPLDPKTGAKRKWKYEDIFGSGSSPPSDKPATETESGETVPVEIKSGGPATIEVGSDDDIPPENEPEELTPAEAESYQSDPPPRQKTSIPKCPDIDDSVRKKIPMIIKGDNIFAKPRTQSIWSTMEDVIIEAQRRGIELGLKKEDIRSQWVREKVYDHEFQNRWQKDPNFRKKVCAALGIPEPEVDVVQDDLPIKDESPLESAFEVDDNGFLRAPLSPRETLPDIRKGLLPREDLSAWGIPRKDDFMLRVSKGSELSPLDMYTWAITLSPYNPVLWSSRAYLFYQMGYFDLAIGDAYRAQLLCEVVSDPLKRNRQPGLHTRVWDAIERHIIQLGNRQNMPNIIELLRKSTGVPYFLPAVRKTAHHIISLSLLSLQCWHDYLVTEQYLTERLAMPDRDAKFIKKRWQRFHEIACERDRSDKRNCDQEYFYERRYGFTRGRLYPYESDPIERATETVCERINRDMQDVVEAHGLEKRFEVRSDVLTKQVKVCATDDIKWGEIIYVEEPSIRGHLQPEHPVGYCENCKRKVSSDAMYPNSELPEEKCPCLTQHRQPIYWCGPPVDEIGSDARGEKRANEDADDRPTKKRKTDRDGNALPSCLEIGRALYHDKACGKDWTWLQDAMRPIFDDDELDIMTHTNEQHGTVLSLLLRDAFSITLKRRELQGKPNLLAHEIDELIPLMGAENMRDQYFPFSFAANVRVPFDILSMLGVDIFRDLTFDTWAIQLVLRKLLLNVIPWDHSRRCAVEYGANESCNQRIDVPDGKPRKVRLFNEGNLGRWSNYVANAPTFNDLYIFPGVSMFNHRCRNFFEGRKENVTEHNVMWDWDQAIPNRIIVWAWKDIEKGEQLCLEYTPYIFDSHTDKRVLGKKCECEYCRKPAPTPTPPVSSHDDDSHDSDSSSSPAIPRPIRHSRVNGPEHVDLVSSKDHNGRYSQRPISPVIPSSSSSNEAPPYSVITNPKDHEHAGHDSVNVPKETMAEKALSVVPSLPDYESEHEVDNILDNMGKVNRSPARPSWTTPLERNDISILGQVTGVEVQGNPIAVPSGQPQGRLLSERYGDTHEVPPPPLDPTPIRKLRKRPSAIRDSDDENWGKNRQDSSNSEGAGNQGEEKDSSKGEHVAKKQKTVTNTYSSILGHWSSDETIDPSMQQYADMSLLTFGRTAGMILENLNNSPQDKADGGMKDGEHQSEEPKDKDLPNVVR